MTAIPPTTYLATTEAAVRKVWDTGTTINDDPEVGFLLEFAGTDGTPLQVEAKTVVSRLQVARVQPGITAQVRYDPQKPRRLQILALHLPEPRATSAAARMHGRTEQTARQGPDQRRGVPPEAGGDTVSPVRVLASRVTHHESCSVWR